MLTVISEQKPRFIKQTFEENYCGKNVVLSEKTKKEKIGLPERLCSLPVENLHSKFIAESVELIIKSAVFEGTNRKSKVLEWQDPEKLKKVFDFEIKSKSESEEKLMEIIGDVIRYSVKTGHPYFVNQLFSGNEKSKRSPEDLTKTMAWFRCFTVASQNADGVNRLLDSQEFGPNSRVDPYGLIGQWLTDALNPSVYTYEVSPVFSVMEQVVLEEMRSIVGFPNGEGDGTFCPGGSISNGFGISCARYALCPEVKKAGLYAIGRLVVFTSRDAHYSIVKLATFMGLGSDNVVCVKTDQRGKMIPEELEKEIVRVSEEGGRPFMVSATAGTTVLGAFDPLDRLADICEKHKLWFHVDAAWGGGCLMSGKYRKLLQGVHRADSVTWNPHKLLGVPQQCSVFLTKHKNILEECHSAHATYLFQKDKFYDVKYDTGDKHIQCGRRADVLKFWFMWKAKGSSGFEKHIDKIFDTAQYFKNSIERKTDFRLVLPEPECTNICFWYIPPSLQNIEFTNEELHKVAPRIKEKMMKEGSLMITYQPLRELPNFFRLVIENSALEHEDMDRFVGIIQALGSEL